MAAFKLSKKYVATTAVHGLRRGLLISPDFPILKSSPLVFLIVPRDRNLLELWRPGQNLPGPHRFVPCPQPAVNFSRSTIQLLPCPGVYEQQE